MDRIEITFELELCIIVHRVCVRAREGSENSFKHTWVALKRAMSSISEPLHCLLILKSGPWYAMHAMDEHNRSALISVPCRDGESKPIRRMQMWNISMHQNNFHWIRQWQVHALNSNHLHSVRIFEPQQFLSQMQTYFIQLFEIQNLVHKKHKFVSISLHNARSIAAFNREKYF